MLVNKKSLPIRLWRTLGPGLVTGASDDDPSGVATYSQAGAQFGFQLLWLSLFSFPLMALVQEMCARLGLVTQQGLGANLRQYLPKQILWFLVGSLVFANTLNIAADIEAMATVSQLLLPVPYLFAALGLTSFTAALQILMPYHKYAKYLKWLSVTLLLYVATAMVIHFPWLTVVQHTLMPSITPTKESIVLICAILGTTISPYLFFWQSSQEVEAAKDHERRDLKHMRLDVWFGMFFSNLIMFFIIAVTAATLNRAGITNINTATEAAQALTPLAGKYAGMFFSLGIISTGLLALPVLAGSSAYAIADALVLKEGLNFKPRQAPWFYLIIFISMLMGFAISLLGFNPIKLLIYTAVINGIVSAPLILALVFLLSKPQIMHAYVNTKLETAIGLGVAMLMSCAGVATIYSVLFL